MLLVIAVAANKSDLFEKEMVTEEEARNFAQSIGAIFRLTSAYTASGIEDLFRAVGSKYLDPGYIDSEKKPKSSSTIKAPAQKTNTPKNGSVKLDKNKLAPNNGPEKKKCC